MCIRDRSQSVRLTDGLYDRLTQWVKKYYRDELAAEDLRDPALLSETRDAAEALSGILELSLIES